MYERSVATDKLWLSCALARRFVRLALASRCGRPRLRPKQVNRIRFFLAFDTVRRESNEQYKPSELRLRPLFSPHHPAGEMVERYHNRLIIGL